MNQEQIKHYIEEHRKNYSREAIDRQLLNHGARQEEINKAYSSLNNSSNTESQIGPPSSRIHSNKEGQSGIALFLVIAGFFIPFVGLIMTIIGIVLAHKARKINPQDGMALAALIVGYIGLVLSLLISALIIVGVLLFTSITSNYSYFNEEKMDSNTATMGNLRINLYSSNLTGNDLNLVFKYIGPNIMTVDINGTSIKDSNYNSNCIPTQIKNIDTNENSDEKASVAFLNGQTGFIIFKCENNYQSGDLFEGQTKIITTNPRTSLQIPSTGTIRLTSN